MGDDDDIAASLPDPPLPSSSRREAAIAEALRRFDTAGRPLRSLPQRRSGTGRSQAGALVAAALVALVGVPAAWMAIERRSAPVSERSLAAADSMEAVAIQAPPGDLPSAAPRMNLPAMTAPSEGAAAAPRSVVAMPKMPPAAPAPLQADPAPSASAALARLDPRLSERAAKAVQPSEPMRPPPPVITPTAPPAPTAASAPNEQAAADTGDDASSIVVTGQHRAAGRVPSRGDWNACTIDDPKRSLDLCRRPVDLATPGAAARAAARMADGLSLAWEGDLSGAIAAFDQAVALSPRLSFAYLNRGLAYQQSGDLDRAKADLDRAVRYAPGAACGYYHRSRLLRERGDASRASEDEERAVAIDWHYEAVVK